MRKNLFYSILTFSFFVLVSANVSKTEKVNVYKLQHETTIEKVEKMDFNKLIELIPSHLQKDLLKTYNSKDNYGKEKMLNSLKLMINKHITETKK